jgi:hypothetical protein
VHLLSFFSDCMVRRCTQSMECTSGQLRSPQPVPREQHEPRRRTNSQTAGDGLGSRRPDAFFELVRLRFRRCFPGTMSPLFERLSPVPVSPSLERTVKPVHPPSRDPSPNRSTLQARAAALLARCSVAGLSARTPPRPCRPHIECVSLEPRLNQPSLLDQLSHRPAIGAGRGKE